MLERRRKLSHRRRRRRRAKPVANDAHTFQSAVAFLMSSGSCMCGSTALLYNSLKIINLLAADGAATE